ncbi:uncharacterized protein LOC128039295 [Gossypium raimondii]|uniref:uncharacterized protein LOC128039295 n=1 Tax=Gossypium raimondii TaxID=29730 RepID=UPI00227BBDA6|nr:uncharacterized protein LOC128039295 [Gossypium raimondii]
MEEIKELLGKLNFSEEESSLVVNTGVADRVQSWKAWAMGKIMATELPNREAMYRVLKSLWFTKEEVDFVALKDGVIIVKFGCQEDRSRILNLSPWLFDRCLFSLLPFEKGKELESYEFQFVPFWVRIYNIPIELMDRQTALDVGNTIGVLVAIDWKDRFGSWTEFMRLKVKIDVSKPLRRIVKFADKDGNERISLLKYERLLDFCHSCGIIGHTLKVCTNNAMKGGMMNSNLQFENWMKAPIVTPNQDKGMRRNGVEEFKSMVKLKENKEESLTRSSNESWRPSMDGRERVLEEESLSTSPMESRKYKQLKEGNGKSKSKRRRQKCLQGYFWIESPARQVKRRLAGPISPSEAAAGDQPRQEQ